MKGRSRTVHFATTNKGKFIEAARIASDYGIRLKRLDFENVLPVTVFSKDLMESRNALTPVELLTALPQITNVPLNESTSGGANSRGDNANVNLRGIGSGSNSAGEPRCG